MKTTFSSLKFSATSYNHNESRFHILIAIYVEDDLKLNKLLLGAKISPPIFVDSRKAARDKKFVRNFNEKRKTQLFNPSSFDKQYTKKYLKGDEIIEENITDDL